MKDKKITGTLEFTKIDFSTSEPLPNTTIEIYNTNNNKLVYDTLDKAIEYNQTATPLFHSDRGF